MADYNIELNGVRYQLDHAGYLLDMAQWDTPLQDWFARQEKIEISEDHRKLLLYLRDYFAKCRQHPGCRGLKTVMTDLFGNERGTFEYFHQLFPGGLHQAYKIAGLPIQHSCC